MTDEENQACIDRMSTELDLVFTIPDFRSIGDGVYTVNPYDPLDLPLPQIAKNADWDAKDRQIEWVRTNFTPGMLAKLYKLSYDVDGMRRDKVDEVIRKG